MGRKKIEIKPLTDERNRNVTFLKRKAGLMKKAYELSVLCGVTVSLLIFSHNGKPYEFSSGDFDAEVDRYNDYEGTIERRRAAEFEAMAKAGEDEDDEDDEDDGKPGKPKAPGPSKSLKGKESFKARRSRRTDDRRDRDRERRDKPVEETFVGALMDGSSDSTPRRSSDANAGLQYALGLHAQAPQPPPSQPSGPGAMPWNAYRQGNGSTQYGLPYGSQSSGGPPFLPSPGMPGTIGSAPSAPPGAGNGGQWDQSMLTTYAWLQIQQAHQEQKRHLLEKQQQQLLELTSRSGGAALFRDILGTNQGATANGHGAGNGSAAASSAANISAALNEFVWPTAPAEEQQVSTPPDDDLVWALSGGAAHVAPPPQQGPGSQMYVEPYPLTADGKRRDARDLSRDMFAAAKRRKQ